MTTPIHTTDLHHDPRRILVIGGTGVVGTPIVDAFDRAGWAVRVMSRHADTRTGSRVERVAGDATASEDVERAMSGCHAVLISVGDLLDPYLELRVTRQVVRLAQRLQIQRIGLVSGPSVAEERRDNPGIDSKYQAEALLAACGTPWVVIRPSWPMESLVRFVQGNAAVVMGRQASTIRPLAGVDLGRMAVRAFERDEAAGRVFTLEGPEARTMGEWLREYCALACPGAAVRHMPLWLMTLIAWLTRDRTLGAVVEMMRYFEGLPASLDDRTARDADRILGAPTTTLRQWVDLQSTPCAG